MKTVIKFALVKAILFLMITSAAAQTLPVIATGRFYDPQGRIGAVLVFRDTANNLTQLVYSFCTTQPAVACQRGDGYIPNSDFSGTVPAKRNDQPAVLNLLVDTSNTGTSFYNFTCFDYDPYYGECNGGTAPAVGGVISLSFTKTRDWTVVNDLTYKHYNRGVLDVSGQDAQYLFAALIQGTVLGLTVNVVGVDPDGLTNYMWTDNNFLIAKQKFLALRHQN